MAGARQLLRAGEAGGTRAHHRDALAAVMGGDERLDPAFGPALLDDGVLDRLDRHRLVDEVQGAGRFARRRADAAGKVREIVGEMERRECRLHVRLVDEVVPVGNEIVDRTGVMAERRAAIHAARALAAQLVVRQRPGELAPMPQPVIDRRIGPVAPRKLEKACRIAHRLQAPTAMLTSGRSVARPRVCICCSARRYSMGMTLTKRGR